jgi:hypothetical protein
MSANKILQFPLERVSTCPTCGRPCGDDELSECLRCGARYCQRDSWECECDRVAREIVERARPVL